MKTANINIKTGYKVTCSDLTSFSRPFSSGGIEYKLNQKVFPPLGDGPLCVFDNLENTKQYLSNYDSNYRIFKCNYEESNEDKIWDYYHKIFLQVLPYGTKLANWVELTEEICSLSFIDKNKG